MLPVKIKKNSVRKRYFNYLLVLKKKQILLDKRTGKDIWEGLYQLPMIETESPVDQQELKHLVEEESGVYGLDNVNFEKISEAKQRLSHQLIHGAFYSVHEDININGGQWRKLTELDSIGMPKIVSDFLKEFIS